MSPELLEVEPAGPHFESVLELAKKHRRWLGFLPNEGFAERARKGTLLAVLDEQLLAYILFDLPGDRVKIIHLCVADASRGRGMARLLIESVSERHQDRRGLELKCRRDFPANEIWKKLGFTPLATVPGRSKARHRLTIWQRHHGHTDLLTLAEEGRERAAIDNNVLEDLATGRAQGEQSRHLNEEEWIADLVELCITSQVFIEIDRWDDAEMRAALQGWASALTNISNGSGPWEHFVSSIADLAPGAEGDDHRHVARALAGGAAYFVTRDEGLLEGAKRVERELRISILRPEQLIVRLDRVRSTGRYEPEALEATTIESCGAHEIDEAEFIRAFLNHGAGERAAQLKEALRPTLATPDLHAVRVFRGQDGALLGGLAHSRVGDVIEVKLARVASGDRLGSSVARQLAFLPRAVAAEAGGGSVILSDFRMSPAVRSALSHEGYAEDGERWICAVGTGIVEASELDLPMESELRKVAGAALERERWPLKIAGAGIPIFLVPIAPQWARELFDTSLAAQTLFGRELHLGLSREHVYYRNPSAHGGIRPPARILWYVTGGTAAHAEGHVRAVSQLVEVVSGRPRTLHQRFARLGVWDQKQVERAESDKGEVMALRFVDTEVFGRPWSLTELRSVFADHGDAFQAPRSPSRLSEHMFCLIYRRASAYAS